MMWKKVLLAAMVAGSLAACSSPKGPTDPNAAGAAGMNGKNGANASGMYGQGGLNGSGNGMGADGSGNPLTDPKSVLSKRSVFFDFDSSLVKDEYKPLVKLTANF